eukprot:CAMPEP_0116008752 /NCGR_PEP_ID=MMETSP0321-20121206/3038_1 /TAXON_ID=163516 /ORGANISM="Leptocylindrus danicus var. danicus, Strain B650" /LENGTH=1250 /DNA_ID=CAMNT_0003477611 /DNA_START=189 /DNA_END=3941 /DNA_ORIENTATION=-
MADTHTSMPTKDKSNSGGRVSLIFRVRCPSVGYGQEIFLCREDHEKEVSSGRGTPLYTTEEMHPWYETKTPLILNLPATLHKSANSSDNILKSLASSNCLDYRYAIFQGGIFQKFESLSDADTEGDDMQMQSTLLSNDESKTTATATAAATATELIVRSLPLRVLSAGDEYVVSDLLGHRSSEFSASNIQKVIATPTSAGSRTQRKSSSALMMLDRSSHHGSKASIGASSHGNNTNAASGSNKRPTFIGSTPVNLDSSDGVVVTSAFLPVHLHRSDEGNWTAEWDYEALLSMSTHLRVTRVGTVKWRGWHGNTGEEGSPEGGVPIHEREKVEKCLEPFSCVPVWCSTKLFGEMYNGFCKGVLWPILHNVSSLYADGSTRNSANNTDATMDTASSQTSFSSQYTECCMDDIAAGPVHGDGGKEAQLWSAYTAVNRQFADVIVQCFHEGDLVWIHGFHLMLLPSYLTRRIPMAKVGMFLHTPFPSSEIFRTLWCREDLLRGMLNADQVGFHLYEYARHFLTCCRRLLGLSYGMVPDSYGGYNMAIDSNGRTVSITSIHAGIEPVILGHILNHSQTFERYHQIQEQFRGKSIMCAIDRLETLKGIPLKLLGFERFLQRRPEWVGKVVLIQIGISAFERGDDYVKTKAVVIEMADSINRRWPGSVQFQECVESEMRLQQRLAILRAADIALITPVRDGLNQIPLEFSFCHRDATTPQGMSDGRKRGICIISDFASSSRIMRGSIHVNPWKIAEMANAFDMALNMTIEERLRRVNISSEYVVRVTAQRWAHAVLLDLKGVQKNEDVAQYSGAGLGLNYRLLGMDKGFVSLDTNRVAKSYKNARARLILLDYGGTILHNDNIDNIQRFQMVKQLRKPSLPTEHLLQNLKDLCENPRNSVFVVSGKERHSLTKVFHNIPNLGLAAEHGMFVSWPTSKVDSKRKWETVVPNKDTSWRTVAVAIMEVYTSRTHGSYIEETEMKVLWQYRDADPEFGYIQSKELEDHLSNVLRNYEVDILHGGVEEGGYVEVRPKGVNKGLLSIHVINRMGKLKKKKFDFALVLGDDHCDEPMLSVVRQIGRRMEIMNSPHQAGVSLPQLQVTSFDIEEVAEYVTPNIETFTCTVGKKPTAAASYLNDVAEVHELLEALNKISTRDHRFYSSIDLRSLTGIDSSGSTMYGGYNTSAMMFPDVKSSFPQGKGGIVMNQQSVQTISAGMTRSMSMGAFKTEPQKKQPVSGSLTQFLGAIADEEEEEDDSFFF